MPPTTPDMSKLRPSHAHLEISQPCHSASQTWVSNTRHDSTQVIRPLAYPLLLSNALQPVRTRRSLQRECHTSQGCAPRLVPSLPALPACPRFPPLGEAGAATPLKAVVKLKRLCRPTMLCLCAVFFRSAPCTPSSSLDRQPLAWRPWTSRQRLGQSLPFACLPGLRPPARPPARESAPPVSSLSPSSPPTDSDRHISSDPTVLVPRQLISSHTSPAHQRHHTSPRPCPVQHLAAGAHEPCKFLDRCHIKIAAN
ncbi:hypothetical protein BBAD15_g2174 [Beauveria bassiana D1-5]|uniref:Uncharacterized protein n=1 Tax=Beauveria bassiana D1-5 TaxID=1245745 RepID=A0A0A2W0Y0_BEABA|nr:hypothetical protein BBAD15_g2174 [Beauveria bassiana D1-5]